MARIIDMIILDAVEPERGRVKAEVWIDDRFIEKGDEYGEKAVTIAWGRGNHRQVIQIGTETALTIVQKLLRTR